MPSLKDTVLAPVRTADYTATDPCFAPALGGRPTKVPSGKYRAHELLPRPTEASQNCAFSSDKARKPDPNIV